MDFVHIDDLVDAIMLCFFNERAYNDEYIISGPAPFTFRQYIERIAEFSGLPPPRVRVPFFAVMAVAFAMEYSASLINVVWPRFRPPITRFQARMLAKPLTLSFTKARDGLGYRPVVDFDSGIAGAREYISECDFGGIDWGR